MELPPDRYSFYRALEHSSRRDARAIRTICCRSESDCNRTSRSKCTSGWSSPSANIGARCWSIDNPAYPEADAIFYAGWLGPLCRRWREPDAHFDSLQRLDGAESQGIHDLEHGALEDGGNLCRGKFQAAAICRSGFCAAGTVDASVSGLPAIICAIRTSWSRPRISWRRKVASMAKARRRRASSSGSDLPRAPRCCGTCGTRRGCRAGKTLMTKPAPKPVAANGEKSH